VKQKQAFEHHWPGGKDTVHWTQDHL